MSVGDLKNNLRKLQSELRAIKYEKDLDLDSISKGIASAFLPLYHYVFLEYSHAIAEMIASRNFEMSGKTDLRFVETMYKVLRDVFTFKPPITKEQFFSNGFVERKIIMCVDVIGLIRSHNKLLRPKTAKTQLRLNQPSKLGPRAAGLPPRKEGHTSSGANSLIDAAAQLPAVALHKPTVNSALPIEVVNEIHHPVKSCLPAATQAASTDVKDPFAVQAECRPSTEPAYVSEKSALLPQRQDPVSVKAKVIREEGAHHNLVTQVRQNDAKTVCDSSARPTNVDSYNPARYHSWNEYSELPEPNHYPADCIPKRAAVQNYVKCDNLTPEQDRFNDTTELMESQKIKLSSKSHLSHAEISLQNRLDVIERMLLIQQDQLKQIEGKKSNDITPEQIETLAARVTLLENKVTLLETQVKTLTNMPKNKELPSQQSDHLGGTSSIQVPNLPFSPISRTESSYKQPIDEDKLDSVYNELSFNTNKGSNDVGDAELMTEGGKNGEFRERYSSTPMELEEHVNVCDSVTANKNIDDQKERILNMLKSTEALLNVQVVTPVKTDSGSPTAQSAD